MSTWKSCILREPVHIDSEILLNFESLWCIHQAWKNPTLLTLHGDPKQFYIAGPTPSGKALFACRCGRLAGWTLEADINLLRYVEWSFDATTWLLRNCIGLLLACHEVVVWGRAHLDHRFLLLYMPNIHMSSLDYASHTTVLSNPTITIVDFMSGLKN